MPYLWYYFLGTICDQSQLHPLDINSYRIMKWLVFFFFFVVVFFFLHITFLLLPVLRSWKCQKRKRTIGFSASERVSRINLLKMSSPLKCPPVMTVWVIIDHIKKKFFPPVLIYSWIIIGHDRHGLALERARTKIKKNALNFFVR